MTTRVTERDKKLLSGLGVFCVTVFFVFAVLTPLSDANKRLEEQIKSNEERIAKIRLKEASLPDARRENEELRVRLKEAGEKINPMMKSREIDRMLTDRSAAHGLSVTRLQIDMPETPINAAGYGGEDEERSNTDGVDAVWSAQVVLEVSGMDEALDRLVDDLALSAPGVQVMSLSWEKAEEESGGDRLLDLRLTVLMVGRE